MICTEEKMVASFDGTKLYLKKNIPDHCKAIVIIVHGMCEHQGRYDHVAAALNEHNIGTYRFDHRGHGRSEGEDSYFDSFNDPLDDLNVIVDLALAEHPELPLFLIGHSMGGFTVSLYGAKYPDKNIRGIVTSGACTHITKKRGVKVPEGLNPHDRVPNNMGVNTCSVQSVVDDYEADPLNKKSISNGLRYALQEGCAWYETVVKNFKYPVLMMHGDIDDLVWVEDTYWWFKEVGSTDRQMKIWHGLYHEIFNEYCKDEVIANAISWIEHRI